MLCAKQWLNLSSKELCRVQVCPFPVPQFASLAAVLFSHRLAHRYAYSPGAVGTVGYLTKRHTPNRRPRADEAMAKGAECEPKPARKCEGEKPGPPFFSLASHLRRSQPTAVQCRRRSHPSTILVAEVNHVSVCWGPTLRALERPLQRFCASF